MTSDDRSLAGDAARAADRLDRFWDEVTGRESTSPGAFSRPVSVSVDPTDPTDPDAVAVDRLHLLASDAMPTLRDDARGRIWRAAVRDAGIPTREDHPMPAMPLPVGAPPAPTVSPPVPPRRRRVAPARPRSGGSPAPRRAVRPQDGAAWWPQLQFAAVLLLLGGLLASILAPYREESPGIFGGAGVTATPVATPESSRGDELLVIDVPYDQAQPFSMDIERWVMEPGAFFGYDSLTGNAARLILVVTSGSILVTSGDTESVTVATAPEAGLPTVREIPLGGVFRIESGPTGAEAILAFSQYQITGDGFGSGVLTNDVLGRVTSLGPTGADGALLPPVAPTAGVARVEVTMDTVDRGEEATYEATVGSQVLAPVRGAAAIQAETGEVATSYVRRYGLATPSSQQPVGLIPSGGMTVGPDSSVRLLATEEFAAVRFAVTYVDGTTAPSSPNERSGLEEVTPAIAYRFTVPADASGLELILRDVTVEPGAGFELDPAGAWVVVGREGTGLVYGRSASTSALVSPGVGAAVDGDGVILNSGSVPSRYWVLGLATVSGSKAGIDDGNGVTLGTVPASTFLAGTDVVISLARADHAGVRLLGNPLGWMSGPEPLAGVPAPGLVVAQQAASLTTSFGVLEASAGAAVPFTDLTGVSTLDPGGEIVVAAVQAFDFGPAVAATGTVRSQPASIETVLPLPELAVAHYERLDLDAWGWAEFDAGLSSGDATSLVLIDRGQAVVEHAGATTTLAADGVATTVVSGRDRMRVVAQAEGAVVHHLVLASISGEGDTGSMFSAAFGGTVTVSPGWRSFTETLPPDPTLVPPGSPVRLSLGDAEVGLAGMAIPADEGSGVTYMTPVTEAVRVEPKDGGIGAWPVGGDTGIPNLETGLTEPFTLPVGVTILVDQFSSASIEPLGAAPVPVRIARIVPVSGSEVGSTPAAATPGAATPAVEDPAT